MAQCVIPKKTLPISVTGPHCGLSCKHCNRHYLSHMAALPDASERMIRGAYKSALVSGGCTPDGAVPLGLHTIELVRFKRTHGLKFVAHPGFIHSPKEALEISKFADAVSFDFLANAKALRNVYGLSLSEQEVIRSYEMLRTHARTIPHLTIGINGGKISWEAQALEKLSSLGAETVVLNVFVPTAGTVFQSRAPPPISPVVSLFKKSEGLFPNVYAGCMRPGGRYRDELDNKIFSHCDRMVNPSKKLKFDDEVLYECCIL